MLVLKNLKGPGPISGGIPSQHCQMLSQRSTSPPSSRTHAPICYKSSLTLQPGCLGQNLEHWRKQLEWCHQNKSKIQKSHNGCMSSHCKITLVSPYSLTVANTASIHPLLPNSHEAMDVIHQMRPCTCWFSLERWDKLTPVDCHEKSQWEN